MYHCRRRRPVSEPLLLFTSDTSYYTLNPTWLLLDLAFEDLPPDLAGDLVIRVHRAADRDPPDFNEHHASCE